MSGAERTNEVLVPWERLSPGALQSVIEEFITREGTDYGHEVHSLTEKVADVRRQLESGDIVVAFDAVEETVTLVPRRLFDSR